MLTCSCSQKQLLIDHKEQVYLGNDIGNLFCRKISQKTDKKQHLLKLTDIVLLAYTSSRLNSILFTLHLFVHLLSSSKSTNSYDIYC